MTRKADPVVVVLVGGLLGVIVMIAAVMLLFPVVHHVGDIRYCSGSGVGIGSDGKTSVVIVSVPCGTYQAGDPGVQP